MLCWITVCALFHGCPACCLAPLCLLRADAGAGCTLCPYGLAFQSARRLVRGGVRGDTFRRLAPLNLSSLHGAVSPHRETSPVFPGAGSSPRSPSSNSRLGHVSGGKGGEPGHGLVPALPRVGLPRLSSLRSARQGPHSANGTSFRGKRTEVAPLPGNSVVADLTLVHSLSPAL